jgi:NitT/TauT family transport system permease protein
VIPNDLMSRPSAIAVTAYQEFAGGTIWGNLEATLSVWLVGFLIASAIGIAIGLLSGVFRYVRYITDPLLNATNVAPDLAFVPLLILWFGIGFRFRLVLVLFIGVFYVAINTLAGVKNTEGRWLRVAQSFGASRMRTFRTVLIPGSMPYIMTGIRQAGSRCLIGAVASEFIAGNKGIGFMISLAGSFLETSTVMFGILLLAVLGVLLSEIIGFLEHRFDAWRV